MDEILRLMAFLIISILIISFMVRPLVPGFSNTLNQQLGNLVGKAICFGLSLLTFILVFQHLFRGCK